MFKTIKQNVNITDVVERYTSQSLVECGDSTFQLEDKACPFCSHNDCFKVQTFPDKSGIWSCFSECAVQGDDCISFTMKCFDLTPVEAAKRLSLDFSIDLPTIKVDPVDKLFSAAADYYHNCLMTECTKKEISLGNISPLKYQTSVRGHSVDVLKNFKIGWSDGELLEHLLSIGFSRDVIVGSGLESSSTTRDKLPTKSFIYPHYYRGKVSHFTFKNPTPGALTYQIKKEKRRSNIEWYNESSVTSSSVVLIVEGENDILSVVDDGWEDGLIACIGSISKSQLLWMQSNLQDKNIITLFDSDKAGDIYRKKVASCGHFFNTLCHIKVPEEDNDIDQCIRNGTNIFDAIKKYGVRVAQPNKSRTLSALKTIVGGNIDELDPSTINDEDSTSGASTNKIIEDNNCYFKVKISDGEQKSIPITNFRINLLNVFNKNGEVSRQVIINTKQKHKSEKIMISSSDKVSIKPFKTLIANAADASFYGSEMDLIHMWEHIYDTSKPGLVWVADTVGVVRRQQGWLFDDCFMDMNGHTYEPDAEGIMWIGSNKRGIKCRSLNAADVNSEGMDIPRLDRSLSRAEANKLLGDLVNNLSLNLGDRGMALTMLGWAWANVYSNEIFKMRKFFPFLFMWGRHGKGKTNLVKWLLALFNMDECGYTTISNLKSAVGFERKAAFYESLPMAVDEVRADVHTAKYYGKFRGWYNRSARTMGTKEGLDVKVVPVRSNFIFCGQDTFTDAAAMERCISLQIPTNNRELVNSYKWIESHMQELSSISYYWIVDSLIHGSDEVLKDIISTADLLKESCSSARTRFQFGIAGAFGSKLRDSFLPGYDYEGYLKDRSHKEAVDIESNDALSNFFDEVEELCVGDRPEIDHELIGVKEGIMGIWINAVFRKVKARRGAMNNQDVFSVGMIRASIKDEDWFVSGKKYERMFLGGHSLQQRVISIRIADAPDVLKRIASIITGDYKT